MKSEATNVLPFALKGKPWVEFLLRTQYKHLWPAVCFGDDRLYLAVTFQYDDHFSRLDDEPDLTDDSRLNLLQALAKNRCLAYFKETSFNYIDSCNSEEELTHTRNYDILYESPHFETEIRNVFERILKG